MIVSRGCSTEMLLAGCLSLTFLGCGSTSDLEKIVVRGQVTLDGQPVENGEIRFIPISGTPGPVSGGPIKDGRYTAKAKDGVPVGKHRVHIEAYRAASQPVSAEIAAEGGSSEQYLPPKYNTHSELTATVSPDNTTIDFDLTSE